MASVKGLNRLLKRLDDIAKMDLTDKMVEATTLVHAQAKSLASRDTGNLAGSIHMEVKKVNKDIVGRVYTNVQYAPYVEFGTGNKGNGTYPYKIKDLKLSYRNDSWVYTPDGGETFYRTEGQVAQPYMYPAIKRNEKYIKTLLNQGVNNIVKGGK